MAISAYIGIPGSGKSYEAVCNVIIPAFTSGRRVVTNIYGLQKDKITERYPDATGEIIVVDNDDVLKADFFPFKGGEGSVNDSRQILPSLPLVRIMYIMLNCL